MNSLELVRRLVAAGADLNARHGPHRPATGQLNKSGATPFLLAAETGDLPLLKLLLELGADPRLGNQDHCTPLLAAAGVGVLSNGDETAGTEQDALDTLRFLLDHGADINAVDTNHNTAMHGAAYKSWDHVVEFLVSEGARDDVWNHKNSLGWTPLEIAQGNRPGNFRPSASTVRAIKKALGASQPTRHK